MLLYNIQLSKLYINILPILKILFCTLITSSTIQLSKTLQWIIIFWTKNLPNKMNYVRGKKKV